MRWIKHLTVAHDDPAISFIIEEMGPEGYGVYWLLLEHLALGIEKDSEAIPSRAHSIVKWSQICHCSSRIFRKFIERAAELQLIECNPIANGVQNSSRTKAERLQIDVPKLLKYRDEYSKKSGQTPAQDRDRETDIDGKKKKSISAAGAAEEKLRDLGWVGVSKTPEEVCTKIAALPLSEFPESTALNSPFMTICRLNWFEDFMAFYWRKDDKRKARVKYFEKVTSREIQEAVEQAVIAQAPEMLKRKKEFQKLPATWLHNECWLNEPALFDGAT